MVYSNKGLLFEVGVWSAGLGQAAALLGHPACQGELDLGDKGAPALPRDHHLAADSVSPGERA